MIVASLFQIDVVAPPVGLEPKMDGDIPRKIPFFFILFDICFFL